MTIIMIKIIIEKLNVLPLQQTLVISSHVDLTVLLLPQVAKRGYKFNFFDETQILKITSLF